jgi:hypothetical protein
MMTGAIAATRLDVPKFHAAKETINEIFAAIVQDLSVTETSLQ